MAQQPDGQDAAAQSVSLPVSLPVPIVTVSSTGDDEGGTRLPDTADTAAAAAAADATMQDEDDEQEQQQEQEEHINDDGDTSMTPANAEEEEEAIDVAPAATVKKSRKRKRRALDSHLAGMTEDEIAAFKASLLKDAEGLGAGNGTGSGITTRDGGRYSSARINRRATTEDDHDAAEEEAEQEQQAEIIPPGRLAQDEINARRRILRTNWRFAAFSQFSSAFPHLCVKDFEIDRLEKDLDGTNPGSYVGEVISRLMYSLTKDSRLAWVVPLSLSLETGWLHLPSSPCSH